jgi:hypothetical protein
MPAVAQGRPWTKAGAEAAAKAAVEASENVEGMASP